MIRGSCLERFTGGGAIVEDAYYKDIMYDDTCTLYDVYKRFDIKHVNRTSNSLSLIECIALNIHHCIFHL